MYASGVDNKLVQFKLITDKVKMTMTLNDYWYGKHESVANRGLSSAGEVSCSSWLFIFMFRMEVKLGLGQIQQEHTLTI